MHKPSVTASCTIDGIAFEGTGERPAARVLLMVNSPRLKH